MSLRSAWTNGFSPSLETQVVKILQESMKSPGVILARDILLQHQERGMLLRNAITGKEDPLSNWIAIRDLGQARDVLRQNEYELTAVGSEEKKKLISFLDSWIVPNVQLDEGATDRLTRRVLGELEPVLIQVRKGRTIIRAGDEVGAQEFLILQTLKSIKQPRRLAGKFVGIFLVVTFFLFALGHYAHAERKRGGEVRVHHLLLLLILTLCVVVSKLFMVLVDVVLQEFAHRRIAESHSSLPVGAAGVGSCSDNPPHQRSLDHVLLSDLFCFRGAAFR